MTKEARRYSYDDRSTLQYWTDRYEAQLRRSDASTFTGDCYVPYKNIKEILQTHLTREKGDRILHLGCGSSEVQEKLWQEGWSNITNLDFCQVVIEDMRQRHASFQGMQYVCGDVTLDGLGIFPDESFDIIFEKGLLDSIMSSLNNITNIQRTLREVSRVLKPGGRFISFSCSSPKCRLPYLKVPELCWAIDTLPVPNSAVHQCYICWKRDVMQEWFFGSRIYQELALRAKATYHMI